MPYNVPVAKWCPSAVVAVDPSATEAGGGDGGNGAPFPGNGMLFPLNPYASPHAMAS